jgi:hypothetical protein
MEKNKEFYLEAIESILEVFNNPLLKKDEDKVGVFTFNFTTLNNIDTELYFTLRFEQPNKEYKIMTIAQTIRLEDHKNYIVIENLFLNKCFNSLLKYIAFSKQTDDLNIEFKSFKEFFK